MKKLYNDDILGEKGDVAIHPPATNRIRPGIFERNALRDAQKEIGVIPLEYEVRSTFNTRPINASDVLIPLTNDYSFPTSTVSFTVPAQTVFIMDKIIIDLSITPALIVSPADLLLAIFVNNGKIPGTFNSGVNGIQVGNMLGVTIPLYTIVAPEELITVNLITTLGASPVGTLAITYHVHLGGTFMQYQGRSKNFEIATAIKKR